MGFGPSGAAPAGAVDVQVTDEQVVPQSRMGRDVVIRDVQADSDGTISGTVVNTSNQVLRDVRLMVRRSWLWDNEMHPGTDNYSRTEYFTLNQDIPPNSQLPFNYRPTSPLPYGDGGRFQTEVRVASLLQYAPLNTAPTAGTTATPPPPGGTVRPSTEPRPGY